MMHRTRLQRASPLRFLFVLCLAAVGVQLGAATDTLIVKGHPAHPTRIMAKFKDPDAENVQSVGQTLDALGVVIRDRFQLVLGLVVLDEANPVIAKASVKAQPPDSKGQGEQLLRRIDRLNESDLFEYVEPDYIATLTATPTDSAFTDGTIWGLRNTGQNGGTPGADIGAAPAWNITTGSPEVIVAVIDTGIRYTHRDLGPNMWRNPGEIPGNGRDDDGDGYADNVFGINAITGSGDPWDDNGHGTHVAGTIGAAANNGYAHVGVAWNARLMACKCGDSDGHFFTSYQLRGMDFAVTKGARIINASFGSSIFSRSAFDTIAAVRDKGVLFVTAAGNDGKNSSLFPTYPASYALENVISVASINRYDELSAFSNYGRQTVHLAAPGEEIFSCWINSDVAYNTIDGTSMAAPHVSGVAALVCAKFPTISLSELKSRILFTTVPIPSLQNRTITGGRVNAYRALTIIPNDNFEIQINPPRSSTLISGTAVTLTASVTDVSDILNATVTAIVPGYTNFAFRNDGVSPDVRANDAMYSASFFVPTNLSSVTLSLTASAPRKNNKTVVASYGIATPPRNDNFTNRFVVLGSTVTTNSSNIGASKEPGERNHAGDVGGKSVWWEWRATNAGEVYVIATANRMTPLVAVYAGNSVTTLSPLGTYESGASSIISFYAIAGGSYKIAVDGQDGSSGAFTLRIYGNLPAPLNDNRANYFVFAENPEFGSNVRATKETGEPNHAGKLGGKSVWWRWTAPTTGRVTMSTEDSSFDTLLAVYPIGSIVPIASNDDEILFFKQTSLVSFNIASGASYDVGVDGYGGASGDIVLTFALNPASNDLFNNRFEILSNTTNISSNVTATKGSDEPDHAGNSGGKSIWWKWTAPSSGRATLSTSGSNFDTLLAVYTGSTVPDLSLIASNDDQRAAVKTSQVAFNPVAGTQYQIAVDGYNPGGLLGSAASGIIRLALSFEGETATLYSTKFETNDGYSLQKPLALSHGWQQAGAGVNGVVTNLQSGGQRAYIGSNVPQTNSTGQRLYQPLNFLPDPNNSAVIRFSVSMIITDSLVGQKDNFFWEVYNTSGNRLFSLRFDNSDLRIAFALGTSSVFTATSATFSRSALHELTITMDFARNIWSAYLDSNPIVTFQPIASGGAALTLGGIDAVWLPRTPTSPGNNYMLFDDYKISLVNLLPFSLTSESFSAGLDFKIGLTGNIGERYALEESTDLVNWDRLATVTNAAGIFQFTDGTATGFKRRFYRAKELP